jgi:hypothetical protein
MEKMKKRKNHGRTRTKDLNFKPKVREGSSGPWLEIPVRLSWQNPG